MALNARWIRRAFAIAALLLVAVLAGFIGYARHRARSFLNGLPARLGAELREETDNFTFSQSLKGRTIFTVRASKELRRKDGRITLKDVGITVYGHAAAGQPDRIDRIRGSEFEYDQATGMLTAAGEVFLELEAPGGHAGAGPGDGDTMVHVKTSGLVFDSKARTAATTQLVEFSARGINGRAIGAAYDSASGSVTLDHAVEVNGLDGRETRPEPVLLKAAHARLDRAQAAEANAGTAARAENLLTLQAASLTRTTSTGPETLSAQHALVPLAADGTPRRVEADGQVTIVGGAPGTVTAERMELALDARGEPQSAHLFGGVRFERRSDGSVEQATASDALAHFAAGHPVSTTLSHAVDLTQAAQGATRHLQADRVELGLAQARDGRTELRSAQAFGRPGERAQVQMVGPAGATAAGSSAVLSQRLTGPVLEATFAQAGPRSVLRRLQGHGGTTLERTLTSSAGRELSRETSSAADLQAEFSVAAPGGQPALDRIEQAGDVTVLRESAAQPGFAARGDRAYAKQAIYTAADDLLTMTGSVRMQSTDSSLLADRAVFDRGRGRATVDGAVRVTYESPPGAGAQASEPLHVLAAHAETAHATGVTVFEGIAAQPVRAWQGGSQLQAPRMTIDRTQRTLLAEGGPAGVHANLMSVSAQPGPATQPLRVTSSKLTYADATRVAVFSGGVHVIEADGGLTATDVAVHLASAGATTQPTPGLPGGKVEQVVATGSVALVQPGRRATGERLVYTAADAAYVLTGSADRAPRVVDQEHGNVTGAVLRFHSGDDTVEITAAGGQRVRTDLPVKH